MVRFSKYVLADHLVSVNSNNVKAKVDDTMFKKLLGDVISQLKKDHYYHLSKTDKWYYIATHEQLEYIQSKLGECGIHIVSEVIEDGFRVRLKTDKEVGNHGNNK